MDGDYLGPLPVRFTVTDVPLRMVVPKDFPAPEGEDMINSSPRRLVMGHSTF